MSAANAELVAGLTRLHGVVQQWLVADLTGPGRDPTRAYADLMFAFAFARLGAAADARRLRSAADGVLRADEEYATQPIEQTAAGEERWIAGNVHRSGATMFGFRIEEALARRESRPVLPAGVSHRTREPGSNAESRLEYITTRLRGDSTVLEPTRFADPYTGWAKDKNWLSGEIARLHAAPDCDERQLRLLQAAANNADVGDRVAAWQVVLSLAGTVNLAYLGELLLHAGGVGVEALPQVLAPAHQVTVQAGVNRVTALLALAVSRAAAMLDGELFPPLVDAVVQTLTMIAGKGHLSQVNTLAELGWACLCWFQRLGDREAADKFLYDTRNLWPETVEGATHHEVCATAIRAGFLAFLRHEHAASAELDAVFGRLQASKTSAVRRDRWDPKEVVQVATAYCRGAACGPAAGGVDRVANLFPALQRIPNTWTTAQYFSRFHFVLVEAAVLAFPAVSGCAS